MRQVDQPIRVLGGKKRVVLQVPWAIQVPGCEEDSGTRERLLFVKLIIWLVSFSTPVLGDLELGSVWFCSGWEAPGGRGEAQIAGRLIYPSSRWI